MSTYSRICCQDHYSQIGRYKDFLFCTSVLEGVKMPQHTAATKVTLIAQNGMVLEFLELLEAST